MANPGSPLNEAMNRLWEKFLPQIHERVATLADAAKDLGAGTLTPERQQRASAEAHKLAGVLGTFGLQHGTELAREAETAYGNPIERTPEVAVRMTAVAEQLREMIAQRG